MSVVMNRRITEHNVFFNMVYLALSRVACSPSYAVQNDCSPPFFFTYF